MAEIKAAECQYCNKQPPSDGPGTIEIHKRGELNDSSVFRGCLECLIEAVELWHSQRNKCTCPMWAGCTCGVFEAEQAAKGKPVGATS